MAVKQSNIKNLTMKHNIVTIKVIKCSVQINNTNIVNVKVCEDGRLFHFHAETTERIKMKLFIIVKKNKKSASWCIPDIAG